VVWNYIGVFLNFGINLLILPAVVIYLSSEQLGIWYVFSSLGALALLMDFGFAPSISRNAGYAWSGARRILKVRTDDSDRSDHPNFPLLKSIVEAARLFYGAIGALSLLLLLTAGAFYVRSVSKGVDTQLVLVAWTAYAVATSLNLYFQYWVSALRGIEGVADTQKAMIASKLVQLAVSLIGLILGYGLVGLAVAYLASGLVLRLLCKRMFLKRATERYAPAVKSVRVAEAIRLMSYNAMRFGSIAVGNYLVLQASTILCSTFFGLETTARYGLTIQVLSIANALASAMFNALFPSINIARASGDLPTQRRLVSVSVLACVALNAASLALLIPFGDRILSLFSEQRLLPTVSLLLLGIGLALENVQACFTSYISTSNSLPYVKAVLVSGIVIVALSLGSTAIFATGMQTIIIIRLVVQMAYNDWAWPREAMRQLDMKASSFARMSIVESFRYLKGILRRT
jgi:O-antigen/teichoic acid export membrane protein